MRTWLRVQWRQQQLHAALQRHDQSLLFGETSRVRLLQLRSRWLVGCAKAQAGSCGAMSLGLEQFLGLLARRYDRQCSGMTAAELCACHSDLCVCMQLAASCKRDGPAMLQEHESRLHRGHIQRDEADTSGARWSNYDHEGS